MPSSTNFKLPIEVPLLLLFFAFMISESVKTNLIIYRTCYVTLGYNQSECALLGTKHSDNQTHNLEKIVEPYAAVINMVHTINDSVFSVIICLFVGPWSDRFGRKPVITLPVLGFVLAFMSMAIYAALPHLSPWLTLLCSIPVYLTGGSASYLTGVLSYVTDISSEANRGIRMGLFEATLTLGIFLGNLSSSYIFEATYYWTVFTISGTFCLIGLILTVFWVPESLTNRETEGKFRGFMDLSNMGDMVKVTFKRREGYERCTILICILSLTLYIFCINGDGALVFLYLREKFAFSLEQYTLYSASHNITWLLGTLIGVYLLHKLLKIPETIMILVGFISMLNGVLIQGLATKAWEIYAAASIRSLGGVLSPMVRSLVSKIVPNEECGKIFAIIITSEFLFGMGGSPLYTAIYNKTIDTDPAVFNYVSAGIYGFEICLALAIITMRTTKSSSHNNYNHLQEECPLDEESEEISITS